MINLAYLVLVKFFFRSIWIVLLATFGIQLLFTFLPPKKIADARASLTENKTISRQWSTVHYIDWVKKIIQGDPQISDQGSSKWMIKDFLYRAENTITLCTMAFLIAAFMGIATGTIKATLDNEAISGKRNPFSVFLSTISIDFLFVLSSVPAYIIAYFLFLMLQSESNIYLAIIALALGSGSAIDISRLSSNTHNRQLTSKYIENALVCGLKTGGLAPLPGFVSWHAFRNSLITILPIITYRLPLIVSSALVVEIVFDLPGLGETLLRSLINQDVPMALNIIMISVLFVQVCVFSAEILVFMLHPQQKSL